MYKTLYVEFYFWFSEKSSNILDKKILEMRALCNEDDCAFRKAEWFQQNVLELRVW